MKSSWDEYVSANNGHNFCKKDIILEQFDNIAEYKEFAEDALISICEKKEMEKLFLE